MTVLSGDASKMNLNLKPIQVRHYGSRGPTVVVLHGGPGAPGSAAGLARDLSGDFIILEPLQRRSGTVPLTVARHVEDLAEVAPRPAILIGCSWGAMLGLSYASRHPRDVSELALVGCGTYDSRSRELLRQSLRRRQGETESRRVRDLQERCAMEQDPAARDALLAEIASAILRAESYDLMEEAESPTKDIPPDAAGNIETWEDVLRLQREGVEPDAFRAIVARVLMIHGDVDPHPGEETRDLLRRYIPQLEYVGLERCGHEPWRERHARGRFLDVLRNWILRT
jgi:pimeloyl-ACP methyl ester carboxylesterase